MTENDEARHAFERMSWDGFTAAPHPDGGYAVYVSAPAGPDGSKPAEQLGFTLVASDHHAAISVADLFNRIVRGAFTAPTGGE